MGFCGNLVKPVCLNLICMVSRGGHNWIEHHGNASCNVIRYSTAVYLRQLY